MEFLSKIYQDQLRYVIKIVVDEYLRFWLGIIFENSRFFFSVSSYLKYGNF